MSIVNCQLIVRIRIRRIKGFSGVLSEPELTVSKDLEKSPPFSHTLYNSQNPLVLKILESSKS